MAKRKSMIRTGDIVRITNPEFFIKTRYEKNFQDFYEETVLKHDATAKEMMTHIITIDDVLDWNRATHNLWDHIIRGIAAYHLEKSKKTGNKKILETTPMSCYADRLFLVTGVHSVMTGTYREADHVVNSYGEDWHESAGLIDRKMHRILSISGWWEERDGYNPVKMEIEDCNVQFVEKHSMSSVRPILNRFESDEPLLIGFDTALRPDQQVTTEFFRENFEQQPIPGYEEYPEEKWGKV